MNNFIRVTMNSNMTVYINVDNIVSIVEIDGSTFIRTLDCDDYEVIESIEDISTLKGVL